MIKKRIFIIHGWEGTPESNWFPWLKEQLEDRGFEVIVPSMPNTNYPVLFEWLAHMQKIIGKVDKSTYLVGYSLGVIAVLRFLESLPVGQKIGGAVLVAGFPGSIGYKDINSFFASPLIIFWLILHKLGYKALDSYFVLPLDYEKVRNSANKFIAIHSDNDPYVPLHNGEILRDRLGAELIVVPKGNHFNEGAGFKKLPIVSESLLKIIK